MKASTVIKKTGKPTLIKKRGIKYNLQLFIAGQTPRAILALKNLKLICEERLKGNYHINIIDLQKSPQLGRVHQIFAIPTLMLKQPLCVKMVIGDLSNTESVLAGLGLKWEN